MLTSFYISLLTLIYIRITFDTIKERQKKGIPLGAGPQGEMLGQISAHSNFQSYVPIFGLLLFFYEGSDLAHEMVVHALGLSVLAGRLLHYIGVKNSKKQNLKFRKVGMRLTILPLLVLALLNLANFTYVTRIKG